MVEALKGLLAISDTDRINYLSPLVELHTAQDGGLLIASLNYDTLIEQIGEACSIQVDDCLDKWRMSGSIQRSDALTLLKLHGSINWVQDAGGSVRHAAAGDRGQPALIFGGINKLRADGPYLDMLMEWRSHLDQCDHLVIIGYSFRDTHVNAIIERWHRRDRLKRVTVVDPSFGQTNPLAQRLWQLSNENLVTHGGPQRQLKPLEMPVQIMRAGAAESLPSLFTQISQWPPASAEWPPEVFVPA